MTNRNEANEIEYLRRENEEMKQYVFQSERKLFQKMDSYRFVSQKSKIKCLTPTERRQLFMDINYVFTLSIKTIKQACAGLTEEDVMYSCLAKTGLDSQSISNCMGSASRQSINQRKYRIKKKMKAANSENLFSLIFNCLE